MGIQRYKLRPISIILFFSFAAYFNTLLNEFVFDDLQNILENTWITDVRFLPDIFSNHMAGFSGEYATSYYRPLIHVIYMAVYHIFGYAPWGFHLINILFHTAVSLLVYLISFRLFPPQGNPRGPLSPPLLAALLFAVHPIHTEAVAWVAGIMDVSFSLFYLLSLYMYMRAREHDRSFFNRPYVASWGAFGLAVLCKEPALTLPLLLAVYDYSYPGTGDRFVARVKRYIPFLIISAAYILVRVYALQGFAPGKTRLALSGYQCFLNAFPLFVQYLEKLLLPVNLSPIHLFHPVYSILGTKSVISIFITIAFLLVCLIVRKENPLFLGLSILAIPLLPAFYITAISGEGVFAERYLYLPAFGFSIVVAYLFPRAENILPGKSVAATLVAAALIGTFSVGTVLRNADWKDSHSLWSDTVKKSPQSAVAHQYLGYALYSRGEIDEAIAEYQTALGLNPALYDARFNLGVAYHLKGSIEQAIEQYQMALRYHPGSASAHNALGMAYGRTGLLDKAVEHFAAAVELAPGNEEARSNLLMAYESRKTPGRIPASSRR